MRCAELVVGHDLSPDADRLLAALERRELTPARVHVVHVLARVDSGHPGLVWSRDEDDARRAHADRALRASLGDGPWARATLHVFVGDPAIRLVELAREVGADLVAVGSHGRKGVERMALGSVAEHVVRFAPCPVLVLPYATLADPAPAPDLEPEEDEVVEALAIEIAALVGRNPGFLAAVQIGVPAGLDLARLDDRLDRRLGDFGLAFVDLAYTRLDGPAPRVLDARFEPAESP